MPNTQQVVFLRLIIIFLVLSAAIQAAIAAVEVGSPGRVRFLLRMDHSHDAYVADGSPTSHEWIRTHWWRMMVYSSWFDKKTAWYPAALVYEDASGSDSKKRELLTQHPDWFLHDSGGNTLFIQYNCKPTLNMCSHYAYDIGNPQFRESWISDVRSVLSRGYKGLWIDDVNMSWRVSDGQGKFVNPIDPRTGQLMTEDDWRRYMAEFMEQVRKEFPSVEILHNVVWSAGPKGVKDADAFIQREYMAADYINNEEGVYGNHANRGGMGEWSLDAKLKYYDRVHALGKGVIVDEVASESHSPQGREYTVATYFLISTGRDALGDQKTTSQAEWWAGYDVDLGTPLGPRTMWNGLYRRDYTGGMVLVNMPQAPIKTIKLPGPFRTLDGSEVTTVSLGAREGRVLIRP